MNIAYMILAHNQPLQLKRLIERLGQPNVYFYIHIDAKAKNIDFFRTALAGFNNVTIIATNKVNWMGYSMIHAELDLMTLAYNSGVRFKYYVLMSGQDYPIKDNEYINKFFNSHETDFISYTDLNFISEVMRNKVTRYHFMDIPRINPRHPDKIPAFVYLYFGARKYLMKFLPKRHFYKDFVPYFGSQWFALTLGTVAYIIDFLKKNPSYIKAMKYTEGPDEIFFHTIIMNSERKTNVCDYTKYLEWLKIRKENEVFTAGFTSLRYMDWSETGKSKPAVLDDSYYEVLLNNEDLFARKFDETISARLMDKIDENILHKK